MTRRFLRKTGLTITALIVFTTVTFSQIESFDFLRSVPQDAEKFLKAYMEPWANAFGAGLNGGWYNTAKPHKPLGFDITTSFNVGVVPTSAEKFDLTSIGLSSSISVSAPEMTPTVAGPEEEGPLMEYREEGYTLASFHAPQGTGFRYVPVPTAQIGIGLPMGTEVKGRFIPKISIGDNGNISLWGVGVMHSITQYFPGDKLLPFDISVIGGFTKLQTNVALEVLPDETMSSFTEFNITDFYNQNMNLTFSGLNLSAIASLNLPVITFYGGLGYSKTRTEMLLTGNFPTPTLVEGTPTYTDEGVRTDEDFNGISIDNFSGLRANIGLRIKLAVITIHADYTRAQYNVLSTGLGISFR